MTGMAVSRRLVLSALTVSSLLCIYILCVNLESPMSWSITPLKHLHQFTLTLSG